MTRSIFITSLLILFLATVPGLTQPPHTPHPPNIDKAVEHLTDKLQLSEDQTARIRDILENSRQEREKLQDLNRENLEKIHSAMEDLREETDSQIQGVLNEEQKAEFEKMMAERKKERTHRGPREGHRPHDHRDGTP